MQKIIQITCVMLETHVGSEIGLVKDEGRGTNYVMGALIQWMSKKGAKG